MGTTDLSLYLDGYHLSVVEVYQFLGASFDQRLTIEAQIKTLIPAPWRLSKPLRTAPRGMIGSYFTIHLLVQVGLWLRDSPAKFLLRLLDSIYPVGIYLATYRFIMSCIESLLYNAGEAPLNFRLTELVI